MFHEKEQQLSQRIVGVHFAVLLLTFGRQLDKGKLKDPRLEFGVVQMLEDEPSRFGDHRRQFLEGAQIGGTEDRREVAKDSLEVIAKDGH